ncbi:MAG: ABC transporter substrate-binding protein [Polaromonas sp.]|nr:ABC transporter substrate-binding protein [Polaromonas sp.]
MKKFRSLLAIAALLGASLALAQPKGTLRQAHEVAYGNASDVDPISKSRVFFVTEKVMNRLVRPGVDGKLTPDLALSWSANATATEWTFKLREGVTFHNGKPFTAADVVYSLKRVQDPKMDSPARSSIKMIDKIEAVDAKTVKLTLGAPYADLPLVFTDYRLMMIPDGSGDTIKTTGIGTGPFKLEKFDAQGTTVLVANMSYFEGPPGVAKIELIGIPDAQARFQALMGKQIDLSPNSLTPQQKTLLERSGGFSFQQIPTGNWRGIVLRTDVKPFDDVRVRKAIRLAVDRKALIDLAAGGLGTVACDTPVGPTDMYRWNGTCNQDIAKARALLAEAGYPNGIDMELPVATVEAVWPAMAEVFQQQVAAAGIRVKIAQVPSDGYFNEIWMKRPVSMTRWNQRPADAALNEIYRTGATWNESFFKDAKFDAMLDDARKELNFEKRRSKYQQAQEYLWENSGTLVGFSAILTMGMTSRVKNLDAVENFTIRWNRVTVD